jgi:hypothetical protein
MSFDPKTLHVSNEVIEAQREAGWPDFHPEDFCHKCGGRNIPWSVNSQLWNVVVRDVDGNVRDGFPESEIICPQCFVEGYNAVAGGASWTVFLDTPLTEKMSRLVTAHAAARQERHNRWLEEHPDDHPR